MQVRILPGPPDNSPLITKGIIITPPNPSGYADVAYPYLERGFWPIPTHGKVLAVKGATGYDGTVDEAKVSGWKKEHPSHNVALRADGFIGIDVDAYDGKVGDQTLAALEAELGELPATISSTSRGQGQPSRIHFYRVPRDMQFVTRFTDVEIIQHSHRYAVVAPSVHPETGSTYAWFGYDEEPLDGLPSIDDFEELPAAWLERLATPTEDRSGPEYTGTLKEWLQRAPDGDPSWFMAARVDEIPKHDFGHDVMISLQASMVALAAQGETGVVKALEALRAAWLRPPYDTPEYEQDWATSLSMAVRKFGGFPDKPTDIPAQDQAAIAGKVKDKSFLDLWTSLPPAVSTASLRERTGRIMSVAYESQLSPLEAATLAWHSPAAKHPEFGIRSLLNEQLALETLWQQAMDTAAVPITVERDFLVDLPEPAPEPDLPPMIPGRRVQLLTDTEAVQVEAIDWWGEEFMRVMREANSDIMSEQIYRLNRWIILSLCFSHQAAIPMVDGNDIILNFYGLVVGGSKVGKSRATKPVTMISKMFWENVYDPDIGGDATKAGMTDALIGLDGLPTYFHPDEADAILNAWKESKGPFAGMGQFITDVYLGDVKATLRATKDNSGKHAQARLNVAMSGIQERISDSIEPHDWETGFINRFVWAVGKRKQLTRDQKRPKVRRRGAAGEQIDLEAWYKQWVARFRKIINTSLVPEQGEKFAWIDIADEVMDRHVDTLERFERIAASGPYEERLDPTFGRLSETILKCAALVAITHGRRCIQMDDYLVALEQAEEWGENILTMVESTDESPRARQVNRLADLIAAQPGRRMVLSKIHRTKGYAGDSWAVNKLIDELVAQDRAERLDLRSQNGELIIALKGDVA